MTLTIQTEESKDQLNERIDNIKPADISLQQNSNDGTVEMSPEQRLLTLLNEQNAILPSMQKKYRESVKRILDTAKTFFINEF